VKCVMFDPYQMIASAQRLTREGVKMQEYPQTLSNLTESSQNLFDLIKGRNLAVYPQADIRLAVSRAIAVEGNRGWRIGKDKQTHKIDIVVALGMAALAAVKQDFGAQGWTEAQYRAFIDGVDALDDYDGSREWRDKRCPPSMSMTEWVKLTGASRPTFGPEAPGAVSLGDGAYRALRLEERWALEAEERRREGR
jgi:hypothetical protein